MFDIQVLQLFVIKVSEAHRKLEKEKQLTADMRQEGSGDWCGPPPLEHKGCVCGRHMGASVKF